jgi:hypothetical protein
MGRAAVDERGFEALRRVRHAHSDVSLSDFKAMVREQFYMLLIDTDAALKAIPAMLPNDAEARQKAFDLIMQILGATGSYSDGDRERMARIADLFGADRQLSAAPNPALAAANENPAQAIAS